MLPKFCLFCSAAREHPLGTYSAIHAAMRALRVLYEKDNPDWFVLLSGSDYPVVTAGTILSELRAGGYDAYLEFREVTPPVGIPSTLDNRKADYFFGDPKWLRIAYDRYVAKLVNYPSMSKRLRPTWRKLFIRHPWLVWPFHPFGSNLRCFGGEMWLTANRRVARVLLDEYDNGERLIKHFSKCFIPEEAYYQTVICNKAGLSISEDNKRYIDWSLGGANPKFLDAGDLPAIAASRAHFARKFRPGAPVLSLLDQAKDQK